jgi:hypothetical protein
VGSLRRTIAGIIALTACTGCSYLTGLTGSQTLPTQPPATAAAPPAPGAAAAPPAPQASASTTAPPPAAPPPAAPPPANTTSTSFTSRVRSWFVGDPTDSMKTAPNVSQESLDFNCPGIDYRQGAATYNITDSKSTENAALNVKYLASFVKTARECDVHGDNVTIKVGVQGRVVVGPAGSPGTVAIPLRYALVKEGLEPAVIWTKFFTFNVTIPSTNLNVPFTHIEEDMTVPIPPASELAAYVVYIGFDPESLKSAEKPKLPVRPKAARAK